MNILLINHYAGSPKHGMEYRPYYLAREWVKLGHNVRIVASSESHVHQISPTVTGLSSLEIIDGIEYLWLKTPAYTGNGLGRIVNMFSFLKRLLKEKKKILAKFEPNIIIASSPHPFIFRGAKNLSKNTNAKLVFEVRDLWPLSLIELLGLSPYHPFVALMQHEENYAYKHADKVASLLPNAFEYMSKHGLNINKFIYTPNGIVVSKWGSSTQLLPSEHMNKINDFKDKFNFLIGYAGSHGKPNALSFLIDAAKHLEKKNIGFILIGSGSEKNNLIEQSKQLKLKNLLFLDPVNKVMIPSFLKNMDVLYIGWENQPLYRYGISANKLYEYMMSARPIIHSVKAGNDPIAKSGCGVSCAPENIKAIASSIIFMSKLSSHKLTALGMRGKTYVINHYDYAILAENYLNNL